MAGVLKRFIPLFDRVLVEKFTPLTTSKGGLLIPESSQAKVPQGVVVAVGEGARNDNGTIQPMSVAVGETVLLPEWGGTKIDLDEQEYFIYKESEFLGKFKPDS
ncbi:10 kDa heat shock protein, mitochondrial-like [Corticium candelabrum]|uniref:10 kDa heat shock protein, mitochondrial-like n=1 Tax=Corticium candelabrum TaxID=121492 RepID=UPI002E26182D|nr:10 kDa heat shock protein, mitochondrial-like [Corticium candelabrum]